MAESPLQSSLFEEDCLLRELGQGAHDPQVALTVTDDSHQTKIGMPSAGQNR